MALRHGWAWVAAVLGALVLGAQAEETGGFRKWTALTGQTIEARLVGVKDGQAQLELRNGKLMAIAPERLVDEDRVILAQAAPGAASASLTVQTLGMIVVEEVALDAMGFLDVLAYLETRSRVPGIAPQGIRTAVNRDVEVDSVPSVTFAADKISLKSLVEVVAEKTGLKWSLVKGVLVFAASDYAGQLTKRTYTLRGDPLGLGSGDEAESHFRRLLVDQGIEFPPDGTLSYDGGKRELRVTHTDEGLARIEDLLARMQLLGGRTAFSLAVYRLSGSQADEIGRALPVPASGNRVRSDEAMTAALRVWRGVRPASPVCQFELETPSGKRFSETKTARQTTVTVSGFATAQAAAGQAVVTFQAAIAGGAGTPAQACGGAAELAAGQTALLMARVDAPVSPPAARRTERTERYVTEVTVKRVSAE